MQISCGFFHLLIFVHIFPSPSVRQLSMERNKREVEEELITIIKKPELDLGTIKIIKGKILQ